MGVRTASFAEQTLDVIRRAILTGELAAGRLYSVQWLVDEVEDLRGLSRTPVREALVRLEDEGMVRFERNRGFRVQQPGARELQEVFQLRLMLEVPAAYNAALCIDQETLRQLQEELDSMKRVAEESADLKRQSPGVVDRDRLALAGAGVAVGEEKILRDLDLEFVEHDTAFHELVLKASGNRKLVDLVRNLRAIVTSIGAWNLHQGRSLEDTRREHEPVLAALKRHDPQGAAMAMHKHVTSTGDLLLQQISEKAKDQPPHDPRWHDCVPIPVSPTSGGSPGHRWT